MRFQHIIEQVYYKPWFITPEGYASVRTVVESKFAQSIDGTDDNNVLTMLIRQRTPACVDANGIGHVNMLGVLGNKLSKIEESCGNTDYQRVASEISGLIDAGVSGIMFDIDSPGGTVAGNAELVDMIQSIPIPTVAFTDSQMCSAAYNVAASCKYIFATKSATIGSIGCIIPWVDKSEMWSDAGLKFDPITNKDADLKSAMHGPSLTSEQREYLQAYVEEAYSQFKGNVLRNRKVPSSAMRGQGFLGTQALKNNLIDGLLTKDAAYSKLLSVVR